MTSSADPFHELGKAQFLDQAKWYEYWSHHWNGYRDIFFFARDHHLKMVGVNAPRDVVRTVRAKGLDSLDAETRKRMPPTIDISSAEHRQLVQSYFDADDPLHSKMSPEQAEGLYQAQVTWDSAMGWNAGQALSTPADPKEIVVVLIGSGHAAYGLGAERQLAPHFKGRIASLIPVTVRDGDGKPVPSVNAAYANYVWGVPWTAQPTDPVLGVSLMGRLGKEPSKASAPGSESRSIQANIRKIMLHLGDAERDLDREDGQAEHELADDRIVQVAVGQHLGEPVSADPDPVGGAEDVLEGVVDHGHQGDDRAERHQQEHRQDQQPRSVVLGLVHAPPRQPISRSSA